MFHQCDESTVATFTASESQSVSISVDSLLVSQPNVLIYRLTRVSRVTKHLSMGTAQLMDLHLYQCLQLGDQNRVYSVFFFFFFINFKYSIKHMCSYFLLTFFVFWSEGRDFIYIYFSILFMAFYINTALWYAHYQSTMRLIKSELNVSLFILIHPILKQFISVYVDFFA